MSRLLFVMILSACQPVFAQPIPPPPPPPGGWVCTAQGADRWGRWRAVQGREFYYQQQAAQDAEYACQYYGLRWCRVVGCQPGPYEPPVIY